MSKNHAKIQKIYFLSTSKLSATQISYKIYKTNTNKLCNIALTISRGSNISAYSSNKSVFFPNI